VDGDWVDYFKPKPLAERVGGIEDLYRLSPRDSYKEKYRQKKSPKVFVQGPLNNWNWRSG